MSIPVELRRLDAVIRERGTAAYVLTVNVAGTPHVVHAEIVVDGACLIAVVGARTARQRARPAAGLAAVSVARCRRLRADRRRARHGRAIPS
jgi:hypothetical protein